MNPIVSVVIPLFNQGQFLVETFDSVIQSTFKEIEIIIVDDGSKDDSPKIALDLEAKFLGQVSVIIQENSGPAKARNQGIKKAIGKYILPLDTDDLISSTYIENAVKSYNQAQR
jgi:glycosyltransferase involved in cell wall biosynthesis